MASARLRAVPRPEIQAPIIVTFHAPADPRYDFKTFYAARATRASSSIPGKLTQVETFRVGCIGAIDAERDAQCRERGGGDAEGHGHCPRCASRVAQSGINRRPEQGRRRQRSKAHSLRTAPYVSGADFLDHPAGLFGLRKLRIELECSLQRDLRGRVLLEVALHDSKVIVVRGDVGFKVDRLLQA